MLLCSFRFSANQLVPKTVGLFLLPACCVCSADELFIPDSHETLNMESGSLFFSDSAFAMDNEALVQAAEYLRTNSMSNVQRRLNYQWLQMHTNPDKFKPLKGGKALSKILRMGLETYKAQNSRAARTGLLRYTNNEGKIGSSVDYGISLSDDKFKFSFELEF
ncbi:hypothetical protein ACJJIW_01460 [Microbulbifer sp. JMSA004]|uniref:hypothetical protein n=1 Tax=unclassified Microbulbifer TaxID=2619833 RepID=UPI0024ADDECA|nr:hypothetical protein [Microbulbifer sp. VAAF005]WHI48404.1 hypothetical protein P0078_08540 [Microbulbifer sp. VAAF005]